MRRTRTRFAAATAAALTMAGLTACSGGSGKAGPAQAAGPAPAASTAQAAGTSPAASTSPAAGTKSTRSGGASSADVASINPCTLLSDAEVATLAPGLGHGKVDQVGGVKVCDWPDSHGLPAVQLLVTLPPSSSLQDELKNGLAAGGGYTVTSVNGLGDEAAAAFQKADPSKGLTAGLAIVLARSGGKVVQLSTPLLAIQQGSADFAKAKALVAKALSRL